ncbi:MAG: recombination regulator RecX [Thermodesulfovibrionia bacterium]
MMPRRDKGSSADPLAYAFKLLNYRPRSKREMIWRLKRKGFDEEAIDETIRFLEDKGLIDDKLLASELMRSAIERKHLGKKGIEDLLHHRGIGKEEIDEALLSHTEATEEDAAKRLIEKRLKTLKNYPLETIKRRLIEMLRRRGFSSDVIHRMINRIG